MVFRVTQGAQPYLDTYDTRAWRQYQWQRVRDAIAGEDVVKERAEYYLPRPEGQTDLHYQAYLKRSVYYPVAERTLRMLIGMVLRMDPMVELPPRIGDMMDMATIEDNSLTVLTEEVLREVLSVGRFGLLLDVGGEGMPVFSTYHAEDIEDWKQERDVNGRKKLTMVLLREVVRDAFSEDTTYLELSFDDDGRYVARRYEMEGETLQDMRDTATLLEERYPSVPTGDIESLPFMFIGPYDLRPPPPKPPFLDLADMSYAHFRNSADYEQALFLTAQPTPYIAGPTDSKSRPGTIGSATIWHLPENTTVGYLEFKGPGLAAQRIAMQDKEDRMATLGARMINDGMNRNEATDTARMRGRAELSLLASAVSMSESAIYKMLRMAAEWRSANPEDVKYSLNRDYVDTRMDSAAMKELVQAWVMDAISYDTLFDALKKGEVIPPSRRLEEERDLIGTQNPTLPVAAVDDEA